MANIWLKQMAYFCCLCVIKDNVTCSVLWHTVPPWSRHRTCARLLWSIVNHGLWMCWPWASLISSTDSLQNIKHHQLTVCKISNTNFLFMFYLLMKTPLLPSMWYYNIFYTRLLFKITPFIGYESSKIQIVIGK